MTNVILTCVSGTDKSFASTGDGSEGNPYIIKHAIAPVMAPAAPLTYRSAITGADVCAVPGTVTATKIAGAGLTAAAYITKVVAGNAHGRTTAVTSSATITTETTNLRINLAFAAVTGATYYDIYCTTAADPLWSGRITETQRANGVLLSTKGAGSAINSVDVDVIGTGLASSNSAPTNTAYIIPASPIDCTGYQYCDFTLTCSRTGDAVLPQLTVCPAFLNSRLSTYQLGQSQVLAFGSLLQRVRVEVRGEEAVALLATILAGTGMSVDMDYVLS
jgi:hypothetical protein